MNNIAKKNKIFQMTTETNAPNRNVSDVTVKNNQIIFAAINNNLQKFVDNDMYIEKELQKEYRYQIGPKAYLGDELSSKPDGYKTWNENLKSMEPLSILQKIDYPLDETIKDTSISSYVTFIFDTGDYKLIGTVQGLYAIDGSNNIQKIKQLETQGMLSYTKNTNDGAIFVTATDGIYQLSMDYDYSIHSFKRSNIPNLNSIFIDDNKVYVGYLDGLSVGRYDEDPTVQFTFQKHRKSSTEFLTDEIVSVNKVEDKKIVTTNKGLYEIENYTSLNNIVEIDVAGGHETKKLIKFKNEMYVTTTGGLFKINDNVPSPVYDNSGNTITEDVVAHFIYNDKMYLFLDKTLYLFNGVLWPMCDFSSVLSHSSLTLGIYNDIVVVSAPNKLYYTKLSESETVKVPYNVADWGSINTDIKTNFSQIFNDQLLISGKNSVRNNKIFEVVFGKQSISQIIKHTDLGTINKIVRINDRKYFLTSQGVYLNGEKLSIDDKIDNGNIIDFSYNDDRWFLLYNHNGTKYLSWGEGYLGSSVSFQTSSKYTNYKSICYGNSILLVVGNDDYLYHKYDFSYDQDPILTNNTISISQIVFNDGKFFILSQDKTKTLYFLQLQSDSTLNKVDLRLSSTRDDVLGYFHVDNSSQQQLNDIYIGTSKSNNFIYVGANVSSDYDISTSLQYDSTIKHISKYNYFYDNLWDYNAGDFEVLSNLTTTCTVTDGVSTFLSSGYSFTKDIYMAVDNKDKFKIWDNLTNEQLCSETITDVKGIYQLYDFNIRATEYGEHLNDIYTYIFQNNQIQIGRFQFTSKSEELTSYTFSQDGKKYKIKVLEYCDYRYNKQIDTSLTKLKNLKLVTNTYGLFDRNALFFVTESNDIKCYIQDTTKNLTADFIDDNIKTISKPSGLSDEITSIVATYDEESKKITLGLKTANKVFTGIVDVTSVIDSTQKEISLEDTQIRNITGNFNLIVYKYGIYATSTEKNSYCSFVDNPYYGLGYETDDINAIQNVNDKFIKIRDNEIIVDNNQYPLNNIKNISYDNYKYHFMSDCGISSSTSFYPTDFTDVPLLSATRIYDVWDDNYVLSDGYVTIENGSMDILSTITDKTQEDHEYNNFELVGRYVLFTDEKQKLRILNSDFTTQPYTRKINKKDVVISRITDHMLIGEDGTLYKKDGLNPISSDLGETYSIYGTDYPKIQDEKNNYIIRNDVKTNILKYSDISKGDYTSKIFNYGNFEKVYQFENDVLLLKSDSNLYQYDNENGCFLKFKNDSVIRHIEKDNECFLINIDGSIYQIDSNFRNNSMQYILTYTPVTPFFKITEKEYLLGCYSGLKQTEYRFRVENNIPTYSLQDVTKTIWDEYKKDISKHIEEYHNSDSTITKINDFIMPVDCSNLKGLENNTDVANFVKYVEFGDEVQYVSAYVSFENELSVNNTQISNVTYICKNYGYNEDCELLVYVPTTKTNYINHVSDIENDKNKIKTIYRKNVDLNTSRDLNENKTTLTLRIDKEHFDINRIVSIEINGNSLPLKMYIDNDNTQHFNNINFSSVVKKSMLKEMKYNVNDEVIELQFIIFGSDAQAIRMHTFKNIRYTVRYHFSSGIRTEKYITDTKYDILDNDEIQHGKLFYGWSEDEFATKADYVVGNTLIKGEEYANTTIDLYPIYKEYIFDYNKSTVLTLNPNGEQLYINGSLVENKQVVIDYGENEGYVPEEPEEEPEKPVEPEKPDIPEEPENDGYVQKGNFYRFDLKDTTKIIDFWKSATRNKVPVYIINLRFNEIPKVEEFYMGLIDNREFLSELKNINKCAVVLFYETTVYPPNGEIPENSEIFSVKNNNYILNYTKQKTISLGNFYIPPQRIITDSDFNITKVLKFDTNIKNTKEIRTEKDALNEKNYIQSPTSMLCRYSYFGANTSYPTFSFYQNINTKIPFSPFYYKLTSTERYKLLSGDEGDRIKIKYPSTSCQNGCGDIAQYYRLQSWSDSIQIKKRTSVVKTGSSESNCIILNDTLFSFSGGNHLIFNPDGEIYMSTGTGRFGYGYWPQENPKEFVPFNDKNHSKYDYLNDLLRCITNFVNYIEK